MRVVSVVDAGIEFEADIVHPSDRIGAELLGDFVAETGGERDVVESVS